MTRISWKAGLLLAVLPLVFTGKAFLSGELYGPADLYFPHDPWKRVAAESGVERVHNPILSDLAFANLPWRAAVREALVNGRMPFWNRFVLGGTPLLATAQAGVFHPSTWAGIFLPLALSWDFSCAFTIFLALLCAYLFFRELCRSHLAALVGAVGWGFSTYVLFWDGWAVGPSIAVFPLLLLGLSRLAREGGIRAIGLTAVALALSFHGGHPETFFHSVAAGAVYFLWEIFPRDVRRHSRRALGGALAAGLFAFCLSAPVLLPFLEVLPHSAEYVARREAVARGRSDQSVSAVEAAKRTRPAVLPFAHGIYGKSPVQDWRQDGSGMPLAYAGAVLFPLAVLGLRRRSRPPHPDPLPGGEGEGRGRWIFLGFFVVGIAYGASAPILLDATSMLPGFALALNYRLVFLAPFGLAGLAALGADRLVRTGSARALGLAAFGTATALSFLFIIASPVFRERSLPGEFVVRSFAAEAAPVLLLAIAALLSPHRARAVGALAIGLLAAQRFAEMRGTYPTIPTRALAPALPTVAAVAGADGPFRIVASGEVFRPNGAALYGLEDVRGYESLVLARFAETYPIWCRPQFASHNVVDDLSRPFLSFLNARYALAGPEAAAPRGWTAVARGREAVVLENAGALPRAFVPGRLREQPHPGRRLAAMARESDFAETAWLDPSPHPEVANGSGRVTVREVGPDLVIEADVGSRAFVATSVPDWPGWRAEAAGVELPLATVNHAFVGFWLPPGRHTVRLEYRPRSFFLGAALAGVAVAIGTLFLVLSRRRGIP